MKNSRFFWLAIGWLIFVTILLSLPGSAFPEEDWFDKIWFDKWVHIFLFGMTVIIFCFASKGYSGKKIRVFLFIAAACFLYGIAMEFIQEHFIPNRSFDIGDIWADGVGSGIGAFIASRMYIKK